MLLTDSFCFLKTILEFFALFSSLVSNIIGKLYKDVQHSHPIFYAWMNVLNLVTSVFCGYYLCRL